MTRSDSIRRWLWVLGPSYLGLWGLMLFLDFQPFPTYPFDAMERFLWIAASHSPLLLGAGMLMLALRRRQDRFRMRTLLALSLVPLLLSFAAQLLSRWSMSTMEGVGSLAGFLLVRLAFALVWGAGFARSIYPADRRTVAVGSAAGVLVCLLALVAVGLDYLMGGLSNIGVSEAVRFAPLGLAMACGAESVRTSWRVSASAARRIYWLSWVALGSYCVSGLSFAAFDSRIEAGVREWLLLLTASRAAAQIGLMLAVADMLILRFESSEEYARFAGEREPPSEDLGPRRILFTRTELGMATAALLIGLADLVAVTRPFDVDWQTATTVKIAFVVLPLVAAALALVAWLVFRRAVRTRFTAVYFAAMLALSWINLGQI